MMGIFRKLYYLLDHHERQRAALVLLAVLLVGLAETAGVASVMPFMAVLANPDVVQKNRYLSWAYAGLGFSSRSHFLMFLGGVLFVVLVGSLLIRGMGVWAQVRFAQQRSHSWATRLVAGYLGEPYEWFLNHHSAELGASVLGEMNQVVNGALVPALRAVASGFVALWLFALLIILSPALAFSAAAVMGGLYALVAVGSRKALERVGVRWQAALRGQFRLLEEMLGGIKDVKTLALEESYVSRFRVENGRLIETQISSQLIRQLPPLAMQGLLFGGIILVLLYFMVRAGDLYHILPTMTVFAFAGYRLLPALESVYQNVSYMHYSEAALDSFRGDLESFAEVGFRTWATTPETSKQVRLHEFVQLQDVSYTYPGGGRPAVDAIDLQIRVHSSVGLVGLTGSGKTTTVDILLGLLRPQCGALVVDGRTITDELVRDWRQSVGYVPQQIFLADDTIEANIAFGVPTASVDRNSLRRAAQAASLDEFVLAELPDGYATIVGERGVRLSGGQRQRIGIARALYRNPDIVIFDEATNSLDNITELAVMDAIIAMKSTLTFVSIAHRLSTVRECDCIYLFQGGRIVASGPYDRLFAESPEFRALAELA